MKEKRFWRIAMLCAALLLVCAGGLLTGCDSGGEAGNQMIFGSDRYVSINPALYQRREIDSLLFSGLTAYDKNNQVVPDLAKSWEFSQTDNVYTFHLRSDVKWQDGKPFTAEDVQFTLNAIMDPANNSALASDFEDVVGVDVVDDHTVRIAMAAPSPSLLDNLTVGILPAHLLKDKDLRTDSFNQSPVGTGPYRLKKWDKDQIVLEANSLYYGSQPKLSQIVFRMVPDMDQREKLLTEGKLDVAMVTPKAASELSKQNDFTVTNMKTAAYSAILYNFNDPLFSQYPELVKALNWGIDRKTIVDQILLGNGEPAYSPLQMTKWNNPDVTQYGYDPHKMKQLLADNGWEKDDDGIYAKNGTELKFVIHCQKGDSVQIEIARLCAKQLTGQGAAVTVQVDDQIDWITQSAYLGTWGGPYDPDEGMYQVFATGKSENRGNYSNDKVDALLSEARETQQPEDRLKLYQQTQEELAQNPPMTFLTYGDAPYAVRKEITGLNPNQVLGRNGEGIFQNIAEWSRTK